MWDTGADRQVDARIDSAVALARTSDVAIVVAGIEEGEFQDRAFLGLPGAQERMISAVAATGIPTVVVLIGGSAITMPWLDEVGAVVMAWYPGEQGGSAIADILLGELSPSARLPITFPVAEGQLPLTYNHRPTGRGDDYNDLSGQPLFPFGHGLSYAAFEYTALSVSPVGVCPTPWRAFEFASATPGRVPALKWSSLPARRPASVARPVIELRIPAGSLAAW